MFPTPYLKFGVNKWGWGTSASQKVIYYDEFRVGNAKSIYDEVRPGSSISI